MSHFRSPQFWLLVALIGVSVVSIWRLVLDSNSLKSKVLPEVATEVAPKSPETVTIFPADPIRGEKKATIQIVEFSDFACPYCAQIAPLLKTVVDNNPGKVKLIWKDFPVHNDESQPAAEAAQCASNQGKFWEYHDKLFTEQGNLGVALYSSIAQGLSLDMAKFQSCLTEHQPLSLMQKNFKEGQAVGLDGTPYLIVGKKIFSGIITVDELQQLISQ